MCNTSPHLEAAIALPKVTDFAKSSRAHPAELLPALSATALPAASGKPFENSAKR
jgi:hypothetical protein